MKKILIFAVIGVLLVAIPLQSKFGGGSDAEQVELATVEHKVINSSILASGTLAFREQIQLTPEVIGQVIAVHVEESDPVKKGDLVITLDPKSYQAQVDQASARVRIQQIAIERQRLLIENLEERFVRQKSMFEKKLVDEDSFDLLQNQLSLARVDLRSYQESLSQARAALDQAQELLGKTSIRSPIDGIVIQVEVEEGETVIAGTTNIMGSTMMVIADPSETLTEVRVDEADIAQVEVGQPADIFAAAYPDTALRGTVQTIAAVARQTPGQQSLSFLVKILLDDQDELKILPGMSVRADIYTHSSTETLAVPIQAIRYDEEPDEGEEAGKDQPFVFVFEEGKAVRRDVKTGISSDSDQEILDGLEEGERIVSGPFRVLRHMNDGDLVEEMEKEEEEEGDSSVTVSVG
ncbi:MAG: efflux RND transporter periplasmic adaptor subunit [Xanthomonadales bacterium]|jgi:HlyD family secretion protein|nr:efflux RND transporter periplasmic adaptor subunit [Xanthomonadales bacterium]